MCDVRVCLFSVQDVIFTSTDIEVYFWYAVISLEYTYRWTSNINYMPQSSAQHTTLYAFILHFRYVAPFRNQRAFKCERVENRGQLRLFVPATTEGREGWSKCPRHFFRARLRPNQWCTCKLTFDGGADRPSGDMSRWQKTLKVQR